MERWSKSLLLALLAFAPAAAHAEVFGQWTSARTLPMNAHSFGAQLEMSRHSVGLLSNLRLSLYPDVDFGFQGGFSRVQLEGNDVATVRLAADFRVQAMRAGDTAPLDLSLGAFIGLESGDRLGRLVVGPSLVASRGVTMSGKERLVPYLGLQARFTQFEYRGVQRDDFSVPIRLGCVFPVVQGFRISGEAQFRISEDIDDHEAFGIGVDFDI